MFELDRACMKHGSHTVLHPVSRCFSPGRLTVVAGPNGAGKSTMLKLLTGEYVPVSGRVLLDGRSIQSIRPPALALRRAVLAQSTHLSFPFTVHEVVRMGLAASPVSQRTASDLVEEQLEAVDLGSFAHRFYQQLSGGEQQRVQLARILCQLSASPEPPDRVALLLDEPVSSLDIRHQLDVMEIARCRADAGNLVIAVLHDLNLASMYADEVIVISQGTIAADGPPAYALEPALLSGVFGSAIEVAGQHGPGRPRLTATRPTTRGTSAVAEPSGHVGRA